MNQYKTTEKIQGLLKHKAYHWNGRYKIMSNGTNWNAIEFKLSCGEAVT